MTSFSGGSGGAPGGGGGGEWGAGGRWLILDAEVRRRASRPHLTRVDDAISWNAEGKCTRIF